MHMQCLLLQWLLTRRAQLRADRTLKAHRRSDRPNCMRRVYDAHCNFQDSGLRGIV